MSPIHNPLLSTPHQHQSLSTLLQRQSSSMLHQLPFTMLLLQFTMLLLQFTTLQLQSTNSLPPLTSHHSAMDGNQKCHSSQRCNVPKMYLSKNSLKMDPSQFSFTLIYLLRYNSHFFYQDGKSCGKAVIDFPFNVHTI